MRTHHTVAVEPREVAGGPLAFLARMSEMALARPLAWLLRSAWRSRHVGQPLAGLAMPLAHALFDRFPSLLPPYAAAIIARGSHLLFIERADGGGLALPGGIVHPGESYTAGLAREVREETGLSLVAATEVCRVHAARYYQVEVCGELRGSWEGRPIWLDRSAIAEAQNISVCHLLIPHLIALSPGPAAGLSPHAGTGTSVLDIAG